MLPNYDEYLIAYKDRDTSFDPSLQRHSGPNDDVLNAHIIVVNGKVIGGWRRTIQKDTVTINANLLLKPDAAEKGALRTVAARYGRFLGKSANLEIHNS